MIDQPQRESLLRWLYTNAPAGWIAALVAFLAYLRARRRPKRIVVKELGLISFMHVDHVLRDKIVTTFAGKQIKALSLNAYDVYNEGSETIRDASFTLTFPDDTKVLDARLLPREPERVCSGNDDNVLNVSFPFINPMREHQESLRLFVLADGAATYAKVSGRGDGWSVRYSPLPGSREIRRWRRMRAVALFLFSGLLALYGHLTTRRFGEKGEDFILFRVFFPIVILALAGSWIFTVAERKLWRRPLWFRTEKTN